MRQRFYNSRKQALAALFLLYFFCPPLQTHAQQPCSYLPADCPLNEVTDYGTANDSMARLNNPDIPREIVMENRLRGWTASLLGAVAARQGWPLIQLSEVASPGFRAPDESILRYELRPPHWFYITWELVVNADSLRVWKAWLEDFSRRRLDAVNEYAGKQASQQDRIQGYMDSANHYGELQGKYMTDHMAKYQQDLLAGNKAGISAYEKGLAPFQQKIDLYTKKAAGLQKDPGAEKADADAEAERKQQTIRFRDASVVIVEFGFNMDYAKSAGSILPGPVTGPVWFTNSDPDPIAIDAIVRSRSSVLLLEGPWNRKPDNYGGYRPLFGRDKTSVDQSTPKRIKCDQVQTIDLHLSGNARGIRQLLALLPAAAGWLQNVP
jgi:hypothetical protein